MDAQSRLSYQDPLDSQGPRVQDPLDAQGPRDPLSQQGERPGSVRSQIVDEALDGPLGEGSVGRGVTEASPAPGMSRRDTEGSLEMETAVDDQENNDTTDSSSTWSPEVLQMRGPVTNTKPREKLCLKTNKTCICMGL